jgi:predicted nucleic acid-binding protein
MAEKSRIEFNTEAGALDYVLRLHDGAAEVSEELPKDVVRGVTKDPDYYIAGVAYQGRADVIVSGDKDLIEAHLLRVFDLRVVSPEGIGAGPTTWPLLLARRGSFLSGAERSKCVN